ncbi:oligosaccharide flippase family protein [Acinetobacter haemolyticus]|uniref:Polysaccharide biosynthesis protein C-terminal domain-containing protein n=1 Tax=Acinetobacter haemolyticus CIP 64.3 = MTCC 9819 TaxID=1217659 RepID=N9GWV1_ACIHA|nr:oligosaccharide flippase family protein [Acinetobacter haemolyticus]ENW21509.1 hypothetical protein F927_00323 [Acinetobacter haemolyticus CIP 64.3 = MTCC 9819]EPR88511.1 hypothetical protein L313_2325 [Acinetobacter haemolyticus CIP 64.3 = MTCC 9819]QXZ27485.1 oligosaccharide flippase family protein [Acinetobacter haemolyticus]SPT48902.1 polysaccharide transporter [Acinetobacter haemolyticus]SUU66956.1 polysaccharide transporter [Acinetobacter haemolyticus]
MRKKLIKFLAVPGRQKIIENFLSLGFVKITTMLLPLLIIPHLMNTIGLELIGLLAIVTAISAYLNTLIDYGFSYTGTREVSINKFDNRKNTILLMEITTCKIYLSISGIVLLIFLSAFIPFIRNNILLIGLSSLNVMLLSLCPSWFFQGLEDMKKIAIGEVFGKIISFFLILFLVNNKEQIYLVPAFYIVGQLFSFFLYFVFVFKYLDFESIQIVSLKRVVLKLKKDWSMFVNILLPNFYNIYSYIVLGFFGTLAHVAIYDIARKVMNISEQALGIISKVYFPILSRDISKFKEFLKVILLSSLVLFLLQISLTLFGLKFIFHDNLNLARSLMYIQTLAPIIYGLMIAYGINLLGALGEDKALRNITIITSLIGFFMVSILTYLYMAVGALLGVMFTWLVRFVLCYLNSKKIDMVRV